MMTLALDDKGVRSRGERVRQLDRLLGMLKQQRKRSSEPRALLYADDLERLRNEARYCVIDAGRKAQAELDELNAIDFTKGTVSDPESQKARHDWIDPSRCQVFDPKSEKQAIEKLDRMIELVERVRRLEQTGEEMRAAVPALVKNTGKLSGPMHDLDGLMKLQSLSQKQAAEALRLTTRGIRHLATYGKLTKTPKGRISCDGKFVSEFEARHFPAKN